MAALAPTLEVRMLSIDGESAAQIVLIIGAISAAAVAIIKALKENTRAVEKGNFQTSVADGEKLALARTAANADAEKLVLSRAIANPFVEDGAPPAPGVASVAADPLLSRIERMEEELVKLRAPMGMRGE